MDNLNELLKDKDKFYFEISKRNSPNSINLFKNARVGIAGAGGIGSNLALNLARVGVGNIHIIDFDNVELVNLNRQNFFLSDVGRLKIEALKEKILAINPFINVVCQNIKITPQNAIEIFQNDEIVCEAFDDENAKSMFVDAILSNYDDKFVVASSGMAGYKIRDEFGVKSFGSRLFVCGDFSDDDIYEYGVMSPKVCMCAALCANVVVNLILKGKL